VSEREPTAETALQHHLEDEDNVRRILGEGTERRLYGAGFEAGWEACLRYRGAAEPVRAEELLGDDRHA